MKKAWKCRLIGAAAGAVTGLFGGGGGIVLALALRRWVGLEEKRALATCVAVMLPLCAASAAVYALRGELPLLQALPYVAGGAAGGLAGGRLFRRAPEAWLRRGFGAMLLYAGVRYLL